MSFKVTHDASARNQRYKGKQLKQGMTSKDLYAEVTLRFRLRPAGWIINDGWAAESPLRLLRVIRAVAPLILKGDERIESVRWRWRRDGDKKWRDEQEVKDDS